MSTDRSNNPDPRRRSFLKAAVIAIQAAIASALGVPVFGYVLGPLFRKQDRAWIEVGRAADFGGAPISKRVRYVARDGFRELEKARNVWITLEGKELIVFSSECTHVGCNVLWKEAEGKFMCPCHGGSFSRQGDVLGGPPPAPLHRLPSKIENETIYIQV